MRRATAALGAIALALAVPGGAAAVSVFTGGSVVGSGLTTFEGQGVAFQVMVSARGDATAADGFLAERDGNTVYLSKVRCVLVAGNAALVVGTLIEPVGAFTELHAEFVDNGNGADAPPDAMISGLAAPNPFGDACFPAAVFFEDAFPVEHGNFTVRPST